MRKGFSWRTKISRVFHLCIVSVVVLFLAPANVHAAYDIKIIDPPTLAAGTHKIDVAPGKFYDLKFTIEYGVEGLTKISANIYPDAKDSDLWEYAHFDTRVDKSGEMMITLGSKAPLEIGTYEKDLIVTTGAPDNRKSFKYTFTLNVGELPVTQLTKESPGSTIENWAPSWSPDGTKITFTHVVLSVSDGDKNLVSAHIHVIGSDGGTSTPITSGDAKNFWSNWGSNNKIVYHSRNDQYEYDLWVVDPDGNNNQQLTISADNEQRPFWSPNADKIVYTNRIDQDNWDLWLINSDGSSGKVQLTSNSGIEKPHGWTPDGSKIVFQSNKYGNYDIFTVDVSTKIQERLTTDPADDLCPSISPDGKWLAFCSKRTGNKDVWLKNLDTGELIQLTTNTADDDGPNWSPDGKKIAFESTRDDGYFNIFTMDVSSIVGSTPTQDLAIESVVLTPDPPIIGEETKVEIILKNDGSETFQSKNAIVDLQSYDSDSSFCSPCTREWFKKTVSLPDIAPGSMYTLTWSDVIFTLANLPDELHVKVDGFTDEVSENNRVTIEPFNVQNSPDQYVSCCLAMTTATIAHFQAAAIAAGSVASSGIGSAFVQSAGIQYGAIKVVSSLASENYFEAGKNIISYFVSIIEAATDNFSEAHPLAWAISFIDTLIEGGLKCASLLTKIVDLAGGIVAGLRANGIEASVVISNSPVTVEVTDQQGRVSSVTEEGVKTDIPNSGAWQVGHTKIVLFSGNLKQNEIKLSGTDEGTFDLTVVTPSSSDTMSVDKIKYSQVSVSEDTKATIMSSQNYALGLDSDGDGTVDKTIAADIIQTISSEKETRKPRIVVLANSIDFPLAAELFGFLRNKGLEVIHTNVDDFEHYKNEKFVVILGGPDAPEEVGSIVQEVLSEAEQNSIREAGARKKYVKTNVWTQGQRVMVIAGSDRHETKNSEDENKENIASEAESGS